MADEPRFIAKTSRIDNSLIPSGNNPLSTAGINVPEIPTFDLDQFNLVQISERLKDSLNQPEPFFMFTSRRRNEKLRLEKERLEVIIDTIERVRTVNQSLAHARAEILLSKAVTESLINNYFNEAFLTAELRKAEHDNAVSKHHDDMRARQLQLESAELDNALKRQRIEVVDFIKNNIKPDDLSPYHKGLLLQAAANPNGTQYQDFAILQELKDSYIKEHKLKNDLLAAQVTKEQSQADLSRHTADTTINEDKAR